MTIERIHFNEPYILDLGKEVEDQARKAARLHVSEAEALPEGEYDLTPRQWRKNTHNHNLVVDSRGEAVYRILPKASDVGMIGSHQEGWRPGGRMFRIPQDQEIAVIAGGTPDGKMGIFEIIFHRPGPSPVK